VHARQQIRAAFATALTGLTLTENRVYPSRVIEWDRDRNLPGLAIYTTEDAKVPEEDVMGGVELHDLEVIVEARAVKAEGVDNLLDDICVDVEAAVFADVGINALVMRHQLVQTEIEFGGDDQDTHTAKAEMAFSVWYRINRSDPETIIT